MISQFGIVFRQPIAIQLLDRGPDRPVQLLAAAHQEAVVSNVLDYGVLEDVGRFGDHPQLVDNLQRFQLAQYAKAWERGHAAQGAAGPPSC
jgi:hypothetical protein